jgi:plastocyanin
MGRTRLAALGIVLAIASGCASRATLRGVVVAPGAAGRASLGASRLDKAVVYAVPEKKLLPPRQVSRSEIRQTSDGFRPRVLLVTQNTEVEFRNEDKVYHKPFSVSPVKRFDLGRFGPGERETVLFDRIGVVQVFCELHPDSWAFIVVLPDKLYTRPDPNGSFALTDLPEGKYSLTVWHPDYGETSRTIAVPKKGRVELKLAY